MHSALFPFSLCRSTLAGGWWEGWWWLENIFSLAPLAAVGGPGYEMSELCLLSTVEVDFSVDGRFEIEPSSTVL